MKPKIIFLEPSNRWINELSISGNFDKLKSIAEIKGFHRTFEDFADHRKDFEFDLISFIQVLYEPDLVTSLFEFIDNDRNIKPFHLLINLENEENDLFKIRTEIANKGIEVPLSQLKNIEQSLQCRNIEYTKFTSSNKEIHFALNEILLYDNHWFYPFILGCSKEEFANLALKNKLVIIKIIHALLLNKTKININDSTLLIKINTL